MFLGAVFFCSTNGHKRHTKWLPLATVDEVFICILYNNNVGFIWRLLHEKLQNQDAGMYPN